VIKLTRKTEYALLALRYLHGREAGHVASVKDIAAHYRIPNMLLAKVMQRLKKRDIVLSVKGTSGGYALAADLEDVSFLDFLRIFEDDTHLVECLSLVDINCQQLDCCDIRGPMSVLNSIIHQQLRMLSLRSLFALPAHNPALVPVQRIAASD